MAQVRIRGRESLINPALLVVLRERSGLTIRGLSRRSGIAPSTISRLERGLHLATPATVNALAKGLGVASVEILR